MSANSKSSISAGVHCSSRAPQPAVPTDLLDLLRPLHQLVPLGDCASVATHPKAEVRNRSKKREALANTRSRRFRGLWRNPTYFRRSLMTHTGSARARGDGAGSRREALINTNCLESVVWSWAWLQGDVLEHPWSASTSGRGRSLPFLCDPVSLGLRQD